MFRAVNSASLLSSNFPEYGLNIFWNHERRDMDTFENATPPQEQPDMVQAQCWECGETKLCFEHLVCCTGTPFHTCPECRKQIEGRAA